MSTVVIRRDLGLLEAQGELQKVRAARPARNVHLCRPPSTRKSTIAWQKKERIGKAAASLIESDQTIYLGTGTTCAQIARHIVKGLRLTVATQSTAIADELGTRQEVNVILLGGIYDGNRRATHGPLTWEGLRRFYFDQAFSGVDGICDDGRITVTDLTDLETMRSSTLTAVWHQWSRTIRRSGAWDLSR